MAWALASPIGASPDDDHHLVSIWCAAENEACEPGSTATSRVVPEAVAEPHCFAQHPERSAACQDALDMSGEPTVETDRGNFYGAYPPVFYSFMSMFAGQDVFGSAMLMRVVNILIFVGLTTALFLLLPPLRRPTLMWGWIISTLPMGVFLIGSNNPSSWAVMGVGTAWIALLGYLETSGRRKWLLGGIFAIATLMAAGARGDAAMFAIVGIGAVFLLTVPWKKAERSPEALRRYALNAILPLAVAILAALIFFTSKQTQSGIRGFAEGSVTPNVNTEGTAVALTGFAQFAYNLLNVPFLWAGNFGEWGLGWLDTDLPSIVSFGAIAVFVAVGITGLARMWDRKLLVVVLCAAVLWLLPVYVLQQGGDIVGEGVQPRYLLPLIVLFAGLIMLNRSDKPALSFTRPQLVLIALTLSVVNFVSLHMNIRRYVTGIDQPGANLDANIEWWWNIAMSPMFVWFIGSAAYAAMLAILVREIGWKRRSVVLAQAETDAVPMTR